MSQMQIGATPDDAVIVSEPKARFLTGLFGTWLAVASGRAKPTSEQKTWARAAAEVALRALELGKDPPGD